MRVCIVGVAVDNSHYHSLFSHTGITCDIAIYRQLSSECGNSQRLRVRPAQSRETPDSQLDEKQCKYER